MTAYDFLLKTSAPPAEIRLLRREHVTATLNAAVEIFPLVILDAPMGFGKTTAARELARNVSQHCFYITFEPGQHSAPYLWNRACEQMARQGSGFCKIMQSMGFPTDHMTLRRTLDLIREHLAGRGTLLIIDDYHHASDKRMDLFLEAVTREQIPGLHVLLLSRQRPDMPIEELRINNLAAHLQQNLLKFTEEDAVDYFALHGVTDKKTAEKAWKLSEGWAAALWLSLQSYHTVGSVSPVSDLEQLISGTVFSRYSEEDQKLLLTLSLLDSFTPGKAILVSGDEQAPRRLRQLREQNALLAYDGESDSYRMHCIFRTFLQRRLEEGFIRAARQIDKREIYRKAAECGLREGDMLQALRFYFKAGEKEDLLRILQIVSRHNDGLYVLFDPLGLKNIFAAISWDIALKCPLGYLSFIYHYMSRVDKKEGYAMLEEAEKILCGESGVSGEMRRIIQGEIELAKGVYEFNDLHAMRERYHKAHTLLQGRASAVSHRRLIWTFGCPHAAFLYLRTPGSYADIVTLVEKNLYQYQELSDGCSAGAQDLFRAEYLLETGSFRQVEPYLMKAAYRAAGKEQIASFIAVKFTQARLLAATGQEELAIRIISELDTMPHYADSPLLANAIDLCKGYLAATKGATELVPAWLREGNFKATRSFYQGAAFACIVHGKSLLACKDWPQLEAMTQDMPEKPVNAPSLFWQIHRNLLLAVSQSNVHAREEATASLSRAVELARPDGIMLSIAEYGDHICPLLRKMHRERPDDKFIGSLFRMCAKFATTENRGHNLTSREQEILLRAVGGMGNQQIAADLKVKLVTVGNSLTRIYKKLGVQNRVEAANRWRQLAGQK